MFVACANMAVIYFAVRRQEKAIQQWARGNTGSNDSMSRPVFLQGLLYTGSFLLCWTLYFIANFRSSDLWDNYTYWVFLVILNPLMGFCNSLVYFRFKIIKGVARAMESISGVSTRLIGRVSGVRQRWSGVSQRSTKNQSTADLPTSNADGNT